MTEASPLLKLKHIMAAFLQFQFGQYYSLNTEAGGPAVLIVYNGIRQEHRTGVPFVDLYICIVTEELVESSDILHKWGMAAAQVRDLNLTLEQLEVAREYFEYHILRTKSDGRRGPGTAGKPERGGRVPAWATAEPFRRALVPPLFLSDEVFNERAQSAFSQFSAENPVFNMAMNQGQGAAHNSAKGNAPGNATMGDVLRSSTGIAPRNPFMSDAPFQGGL